MAGPERVVDLGFVALGEDSYPQSGKTYPVVAASTSTLSALAVPTTAYKALDLDLYGLFIDELPEFWSGSYEGFCKVEVSTRDPQNIEGAKMEALFASDFKGHKQKYAPTFLFRGVFRNILFRDIANIRFDLFEKDGDLGEAYKKIKGIVDGAPGLKTLDVLNGIPYLGLATQVFEGVVKAFGKNSDDHVWGEMPVLDLNPIPGGAFLRTGIYVLFEKSNAKKQKFTAESFNYKDSTLILRQPKDKKGDTIPRPSHLVFGMRVKDYPVSDK